MVLYYRDVKRQMKVNEGFMKEVASHGTVAKLY